MAETSAAVPTSPRRRSWLKILGVVIGVFLVLLVVLYFVATSAAFFKGVILPKAGKTLNATITVGDASISPFKQVVLKDLKVQTTGPDPLLTASEVRLDYSLMAILGGNIKVDLVSIASPTITVVVNADGTSNLDPLLKSAQEAPKTTAPPSKPAQIDLKKLAITGATLRQVKIHSGGKRDVAELSDLSLTIENVKNGGAGTLTLSTGFKVENNPPAPGSASTLVGRAESKMGFGLTGDLQPGNIEGSGQMTVAQATGSLADAAGLGANLDLNITPDEIKQVALRLNKADLRLGDLLVSGPFKIDRKEGKLTIQLFNVNKNLLDLAGASSGLTFGSTTINSTNQVQLSKGGAEITAVGQLNLRQFEVTRTNQTTPPLDLRAEYNVRVDTASSNALVQVLSIDGQQSGKPVFQGQLASPMSISWGTSASPVGDSTFKVALTHLDLADWKPFLGNVAPAGEVNATLQVVSRQAGKQLDVDLDSRLEKLTLLMGTNEIANAMTALRLKVSAADLKRYTISDLHFDATQAQRPLITASGSGHFDTTANSGEVQLKSQSQLANLAGLLSLTNVTLTAGTLDTDTKVVMADAGQTITGTASLANLSGKLGGTPLDALGANVDMDINVTTQKVVQIRKFQGRLAQGPNAGGSFQMTGTHDIARNAGQMNLSLTNLNQNFLRPFLQASLGEKRLVSVAINGNASAQYALGGASTAKADLQVTNLVVSDPANPQLAATPLEAKVQLDSSMNGKVIDLRQVQLTLTPTDRAKNALQLTGRVDLTDTNAMSGNLKLAADSLDVTRYYDLFAGARSGTTTATGGTTAPATPSSTPSTAPGQEPAAMQLPATNFVAEAAIGKFYLHEVEITNWQTTVRIDGGKVLVKPFQLNLNGAPMSGTVDLDLGVPGFKYDVSYSAQQVPLAPLVNTFQPERRGQIGGTFTAVAQIKGAGITGASLQKNLSGQFDFGSTNLNLAVINIKSPVLRTLINVVALIPELVKSPDAALGSLLSSVFGQSKGGLADDLSKSPLDVITAKGSVAQGTVQLENAVVQSPAFQAQAQGTVLLATELTNSALQIPITIALSRAIAERLNLVTSSTPTNAPFVALPQFVTMRGTVGNPKTEINKLALAGVAVQSLGGNKIGGQVGSMLGGILGGGSAGKTNAPGGTTTNQNAVGDLLRGLGGILGGGSSPTNAPPATNQPPARNLLDSLFGPGKK